MKTINNEIELQNLLNDVITKVMNEVVSIMLDELYRIIDTTVYGYNETWGGRTEQFRNSWEKTKAIISGNVISSEIFQEFTTMIINNERWQHSDPWSSLMPNSLNEIIENGLDNSNFGFPNISPRPFWEEFNNYVNNNFTTILQTECAKLGIVVSKGDIEVE